jgi:Uma2 family endonuclease
LSSYDVLYQKDQFEATDNIYNRSHYYAIGLNKTASSHNNATINNTTAYSTICFGLPNRYDRHVAASQRDLDMTVSIPLQDLEVTPGNRVCTHHLSWSDFTNILENLSENRPTRIAYHDGTLEIMSPLAIHERPHRIIASIITTILESQERDWEDFGSTTIKRSPIAGIAPDTCFYIQNAAQVQGCTNLDLANYPPPDLAIESDVTSLTVISAYVALQIPEVWVYRNHQLTIYILEDQSYRKSTSSLAFPMLPVVTILPQLVNQAIDIGTRKTLQNIRKMLSQT